MARHSIAIKTNENASYAKKEAVNGDGASLEPGKLVEQNSTLGQVATPGSTSEAGFKIVVDKYNYGVDESYPNNDTLFYNVGQPGEKYWAKCNATGSDINPGVKLEKATDGTLTNTDSGVKVAVARGTLATGDDPAKIEVEVL